MFVKEDNNKIIRLLKHLLLIYERFLKKQKLEYLHKFIIKVINSGLNHYQQFDFKIKKEKIYNKLYKEAYLKELKIKELEKKIYEDESLKYPFTPTINFKSYFNYDNMNYNKKKINEINNEPILKSYTDKNINNHYRSNSIQIMDKKNNYYSNRINNSALNIKNKILLSKETLTNNNIKIEMQNTEIKNNPKKNYYKKKINSHSNSISTSIKYNDKTKYNSRDIQNNLSSLFNSRLHKKSKTKTNFSHTINNNNKKTLIDNSTSNLYDKATNYISGKQSRTEQTISLNEGNNLNNKNEVNKILNDKSKDNLYNLKFGKNNNNILYPLNFYPPQSNSSKSTYFISPRNDSLNNKIILKNNKLIPVNTNYSKDFTNESSKKVTTQNSKGKISIIEQNNLSSNIKNNNNNDNNNEDLKKMKFKKDLIINNAVEYFYKNNNDKEKEKIDNNNSFPITLQTISDSKLYELANRYITTDESLEKFRYLTGNIPKKFNKNYNC